MSKLSYQEQSVNQIQYRLIHSPAIDMDFNILESRIIEWQGNTLIFSIIGSSHFVKINPGKSDEMMELMACVEIDEKNLDIIDQLDFSAEDNYCSKLFSCANYNYTFTSNTIEDKIYKQEQFRNKYLTDNCDFYLEYKFPSNEGLAITSIEVFKQVDNLSWVTFHSYPEEAKIIKTRSLLERRGIN